MTTNELIKKLSIYPSDTLVVMSKDSEGNSFSPLASLDNYYYIAHNSYSGDLVDGPDKEDYEPEELQKVVCLWPTN